MSVSIVFCHNVQCKNQPHHTTQLHKIILIYLPHESVNGQGSSVIGWQVIDKADWLLLGLRTCLGPGPGWLGWLSPAPCSLSSSSRPAQVYFHGSGRGPRKRESTQGPLRPGLRIGSVSLSLVFSGQHKSQGQPRFKGWGNKSCPSLKGVDAKSKIRGIWEFRGFLFAVSFLPWIGFQLLRSIFLYSLG